MPRSRSRSLESRMHVPLQLAVAELAALLEQAVDQRRLAMVNVGNDGDVADIGAPFRSFQLRSVAGLRHMCVTVWRGVIE